MSELTPETLRAKARDRFRNGLLHRIDIAIIDAHADAWEAEQKEAAVQVEAARTIARINLETAQAIQQAAREALADYHRDLRRKG